MLELTYPSSGGSGWLEDKDWKALEKAGWVVSWYRDYKSDGTKAGDLLARMRAPGRWLGALASEASKSFETPAEAMREFEKITGQVVSDEGCNCCGAPHSFSWAVNGQYEYAYGENCLPYLFGDDVPTSLREALERGRK